MIDSPSHPVLRGVAGVHAALDAVGDAQPVYLSAEEKRRALRELCRAEARLAAVKMSVLAAAADVADLAGARDAGGWLASDQHVDRREARADLRLAQALDARWGQLAASLAAGQVHVGQARVIALVLDDLADGDGDGGRPPRELLLRAEQTLIAEAERLAPAELRRLGRRLWEIVDPEGADRREAARLADAEAHADRKQRLDLRPLGDGTTRIGGVLPDAVAHRLTTYLEAFAQPRKQAAEADGRPAPYPRLLARALGDLLERIDPQRLPDHGGDATTVIVTIDHARLVEDLGAAELGFDVEAEKLSISAAQARRLACQAGIVPMVLGGPGEILDVGRKDRLHTPAMRKAIRLRDQTCRAQGCGVKGAWCEVHHLVPWSEGGRTSVRDGTLLCSHHHHLIHRPDYDHERLPDGTIRYYRRR